MQSVEEILQTLNPSQKEAVQHLEGPLMVIAGAGSGKTRVLTFRIAYMIAKGVNPQNILALTFTNKAAKEMRERITDLVGAAASKSLLMGTFHSIFYKIIRVEAQYLGFTNNLLIYDTDDSKSLLKNIIKELNLDPKHYAANDILKRISSAKSNLISAQDYANSREIQEADKRAKKELITEIYKRYTHRLRTANAMDFDDLLYYMNVLLRDFPELLYKYQNRFRYILVDEYQDTNFAQYLIIRKLSALYQNICVVGDDAQSIYAFRGATIDNILNFKKDYPGAKMVKLEQNYRSTQNIVNAANAIIANNKRQIHKNVWTDNTRGDLIEIIEAPDEKEEGFLMAQSMIEHKQNFQLQNSQIAVLYRTNAQSRAIEDALVKKGIPYVIHGGLSFYKRKEIKDVLGYFRLIVNHYDEEALRRVINFPQRGIGSTTIDKIIVCATENQQRMWDVVENPEGFDIALNAPTKEKLKNFALRIKKFHAIMGNTDAHEVAKEVLTSFGLFTHFAADPSEEDRKQNVEELLSAIKAFVDADHENEIDVLTGEVMVDFFPTIERFLEGIALLTDTEEEKEGKDTVRLMTIHASKGLEFDYVYIAGMEENNFPSNLSVADPGQLEEERRLFYVAMTRSRKKLILSHANQRYKFGSLIFCSPSRFVDEIPDEFVKQTIKASSARPTYQNERSSFKPSFKKKETKPSFSYSSYSKPVSKPTPTPVSPSVSADIAGEELSTSQVQPGIPVFHTKFGRGIVRHIEGEGANIKAFVVFETVGEKPLMLNFAKLRSVK